MTQSLPGELTGHFPLASVSSNVAFTVQLLYITVTNLFVCYSCMLIGFFIHALNMLTFLQPAFYQRCTNMKKRSNNAETPMCGHNTRFTHREYIFCASMARLNSLAEMQPSLLASNSYNVMLKQCFHNFHIVHNAEGIGVLKTPNVETKLQYIYDSSQITHPYQMFSFAKLSDKINTLYGRTLQSFHSRNIS